VIGEFASEQGKGRFAIYRTRKLPVGQLLISAIGFRLAGAR
jgi:hypothetical protein